jgi:hypothetical protein
MGAPSQTCVFHPFVEDGVLAAFAALGKFGGLGTRTAIMQRFFSDVLPPAILNRQSKATFSESLWTEASRTFAVEWTGTDLGSDLVDPSLARDHWRGGKPNLLSVPLFQRAWLNEQHRDV